MRKTYNLININFVTTKAFLVILICLFSFFSIYIPYKQRLQNIEQLVAQTQTATISAVRAIEIRYEAINDSISSLTDLDFPSEKNSWVGDAQIVEQLFPEIDYLAWVDKNFLINKILPLEGNENTLNKNAITIQDDASSINQWNSVYKGNSFQGFILSSINLPKLIQPFKDTQLEGFLVQIIKNGEVIYHSSNWDDSSTEISSNKTLSLQNSIDISFSGRPSNALILAIEKSFYSAIALSLMISILTLLTIFFAQKFYFYSKLNESRYLNLLDDANLLAIIINIKGIITYCNDYFLTSTGWTRQDIIGANFSKQCCSPQNKDINQIFLDYATNKDLPNHMEFPLLTKSGNTRWIRFNRTIQRNVKGTIIGFSALGEDVTEQKKSKDSLDRQFEFLKTLFLIDQAITAREDISETFSFILEQVNQKLGSKASTILLYNSKTKNLEYAQGKGFKFPEIKQTSIALKLESNILTKPYTIANIQNPKTGFSRSRIAIEEGLNWYHEEPLIIKGKTKGILEVFFSENFEPTDNWYSYITAIAQQTAIGIDNSILFTDLEKSNLELLSSYESTIEGWSKALELRDMETKNHSIRVTQMTMQVCKLSGMSENELHNVKRGALLHDIGKMGIPDSILLKKEKLTDSDWAIIRKHPQYAYDLLYPIEYLRPAIDIPYCHHEKWDGSGYPQGLKGDEIPLSARIFAVIDVWDALLSDRPYRNAWPLEKVIEEIKNLSGTHFDPKAVNLFLTVISEMEQQSITAQ